MSALEDRSVQGACSILAAAACIVDCAIERGTPVSCIELQHLLVLLQNLTVEETGQKCFSDENEQWRTGPVFRSVWEACREWGRDPILRVSEASEMRLVDMRIVRIPCTVSEACRKRAGSLRTGTQKGVGSERIHDQRFCQRRVREGSRVPGSMGRRGTGKSAGVVYEALERRRGRVDRAARRRDGN